MQEKPIETVSEISPAEFHDNFECRQRPVILRGAVRHWSAMSECRFPNLSRRFGHQEHEISENLPTAGSPFEYGWTGHITKRNFGHFVDGLEKADCPAYLHRVFANRFPGLRDFFDFGDITNERMGKEWDFLWVGTMGTRSGLHFDLENNLLAQIVGRKAVTLISPEQTGAVYPFADNIFKSRIDPEAPDEGRFPATRSVTALVGELHPADVLYIPQPWWHNLTALDPSVSISHVYGKECTLNFLVRRALTSNSATLAATIRSFTVNGILGADYDRRMFSDPPTGKYLFDLIANGVRRRFGAVPYNTD